MTCEHAGCLEPATVKVRFGDGSLRFSGRRGMQTFVRYCDQHYDVVDRLFVLCDKRAATDNRRPKTKQPRPKELGAHPGMKWRNASILVELATGFSIAEVARKYGVSQARISQIKTAAAI